MLDREINFNLTQKQSRVWLYTVCLSIVLHIAFLFQLALPSLSPSKEKGEQSPIEITDLEEYLRERPELRKSLPTQVEKEKQIAETEDAQNREKDPNAKFLGEHDQKVVKEEKASRVDDFRDKSGSGSATKPEMDQAGLPPQLEKETKSETTQADGEIPANPTATKTGVKRDWKTLSLKDLSVGGDGGVAAATDDRLKTVDRGEKTLLSTREFKFFGYYHRIKELLRQYWKPNVEHQLARIWGKGKQVTEDELTTQVLVLLDEKGAISKISKLGSSGYTELDEAAVEAFQRAAPFPNPPAAMLDEDGFVRIHWDFVLTTDNGPRIQFRTVGSVPP